MLGENLFEVLDDLSEQLSGLSETDRVTDEEALQIRDRIVSAIPSELRFLYPEDDTLAALVFAEIFYRLQLGGK